MNELRSGLREATEIIYQLCRCLLGRHSPIGFSDGHRTIILCEGCTKRLHDA